MAEIPPIELPNVHKKSNEVYLQDYDLDDDLIVSSPSSSKSIVDICDPVDAISTNREETRLVVAGCRGVLRVFQFAEDGFRQLVDLRPLIQFPAHQGYAASIALNPRERHLIASGGGRDKFIKVWNCSSSRPSAPTYQVETMAPVGRVYWRPDPTNVFHIASCAVVNDMNVHIWDIRRPFLPFASFENHSDSVTDIWWSLRHPNRIVSCGKDGLLVLHRMEQKQSPLTYACDVALDIAPDGLIAVAANSHIPIIKHQEQFLAMKRHPYDPFRTPVRSLLSCGLPENARNTLQPSSFYKLAERYLAGGRPLRTLCNHNANLAAQLGQASVAQSWRLVGALLEQSGLQKVYDHDAAEATAAYEKKYVIYKKEMELHGKKVPEPPRSLTVRPTHLTRFVSHYSNLYRLKKGGDFYFGAGELTKTAVEKGIENPHYNDFTGLKDEAFALKPDLTKLTFMSVSSDDDGHIEKEHIARMNWDPMQEVVRLLRYHADQGDMQTCATVSLVCGRRLSNVMDDFTVESWKESYIAMLDQLDLHTAVAGVKKYSWIKRLNQRSLETERKCPVGECMCACGTNVAQNPRKKTNVKLSQRLGDLIRIVGRFQ
uniref:GATOR2 complex protein WDR24 n=1 Tax=Angiostrongylus cantonensis TaxID=6313 RepID=A0A158PAG2_ANGCA